MNEVITVFYSKKTGQVKSYVTGSQDFNYFGEDKEDFETIYGRITVEEDNYIYNNFEKMIVKDGELKIMQDSVPDKYTLKEKEGE